MRIIPRIHASALSSSTGKLADRGHNTLTPVIFTEGLLYAHLCHLCGQSQCVYQSDIPLKRSQLPHTRLSPLASTITLPSPLPPSQRTAIHLIPRTAILQQFLGYWPYRKGLKVDAAVLAKLQLTLPAYCKRGSHLSTVDKRDAYLAAIYTPSQ